MKNLWTTPYHPQINGLVERSHQMIIWMIGKVGGDKKANWPLHLAKIADAYNATHSAVTGYSPHYLMFGQRPRLPVDFYFPTIGSTKAPMREASAKHVDEYVASVQDRLRTTLWEVQTQLKAEACQQKHYYNWKIVAVNLKPGVLVLVKSDAFKERGRSRIGGKRIHGGGTSDHARHPLLWSDGPMQKAMHPALKVTTSRHIRGLHSLVYRHMSCTGQVC